MAAWQLSRHAFLSRTDHQASDYSSVSVLLREDPAAGTDGRWPRIPGRATKRHVRVGTESKRRVGLTKWVLEFALEGEITDHLGYDRARSGRQEQRQQPQRHPQQDRGDRRRPGGGAGFIAALLIVTCWCCDPTRLGSVSPGRCSPAVSNPAKPHVTSAGRRAGAVSRGAGSRQFCSGDPYDLAGNAHLWSEFGEDE